MSHPSPIYKDFGLSDNKSCQVGLVGVFIKTVFSMQIIWVSVARFVSLNSTFNFIPFISINPLKRELSSC